MNRSDQLCLVTPGQDMEAETASLSLHKSIAFRLPALQLDASPLEKRQANECPREMRVLAASENAVYDRRMRQWLKKRTAFLKHNQRKVSSDTDLQTFSVSELPQEILKNSNDAMGFLAREITEVKDALENNKSKLERDKIKGLKKVVAGVLHTLRQDQLKTVLDSVSTSSNLKYENITQAASLSPRILKKAEKREPLNRDIHVCKGCKEGGLLPWMYLYPDHEVYRTGGGFDCVEFLLPAVHSEKPVTKPRVPFDKHRGKLVDTSMHKLPDRLPAQTTKPIPFKFKRERQASDSPLRGPHAEINPSPIRKVEFEERRPRTVPELEEKNMKVGSKTGKKLDRSGPMHSSLETILSSRDKESDLLNNTISSSSSNNTLIFGWQTRTKFSMEADSGVVTAASSASEGPSLEGVSLDEKEWRKTSQLNELSTLQKRLTGLKRLGPVKVARQKVDNALPKGPKKLVVRKSMAVTMPHAKGTRPAHNSGLLSKSNESSAVTQNAFGVRMKQLKSVPNRKTSKAVDPAASHKESTGSTVSDMSINFSASLSLEATSQRDSDEYSDFTLTGSQVTGTKRFLKDRTHAPRPKERKVSKIGKRLDNRKPGGKESSKQEKINKKGRKESKIEVKKNEPTEVIVDIISSMISESASSETFQIESTSRLSSCIESRQSLHKGMSDKDVVEDEASDQFPFDVVGNVDETNMDTDEESYKTDEEVDEEVDEEDDEEDDEEMDEADDLPELGRKASGGRSRRKMKKRRTLKFRTEPLSKFALKRRHQEEFEFDGGMENEDDLSMLDYAARYCIISLQKLSKYEHVFTSYADCGGENAEHGGDDISSDMAVESDEQRKLLDDYEKLIYGMDICQQKISDGERKRADLNGERDTALSCISSLQIDEKKRKLLEKSIQAFSKKITTVDEKIKTFIDNMKKLIEKKHILEDKLRQSAIDSGKIDKIIKNSDFLGRKFTKLKCLKIKIDDLPEALRSFNSNFDDEDFRFVHHVLKLPQNDSIDFKAFAVVAALTERVKSLDKSIKALLKDVDLGTLERKLDKCKELYRLLSEENHHGDRIVPLENLLVELQAGGLDKDHQTSVIDKLNHHGNGFVDFLDFVLYIPLFLMIHDQIVQKPFQ